MLLIKGQLLSILLFSITLCWSYRLKSFSFKERLQFTLELPKSLLLADVAIRVIQMDFDPLSPMSGSYQRAFTR